MAPLRVLPGLGGAALALLIVYTAPAAYVHFDLRLYDSLVPFTRASAGDGRTTIVDGPFAETKEVLAGFNLIEAADMEEATRMAQEFPWTRTGCIELRPIRDMDAVRRRVGA